MSFTKPSWIAAALVGVENAACVVAVTSQTVFYPTPAGPFTTDVPVRNDRTPFQMTALHTAVGVLLFADQRPLGWLSPGSEVEDDDWPTIAMRALNPPETSPVPMGLDVVAPMTEPAVDFADVVRSMEEVSGADLSHLLDHQPPGVRSGSDAAEATRTASGFTDEPGTTEPFAIILLDTADDDFSNLFIGDDAAAYRRITSSDPGSGGAFDDVLFAASATMRSEPTKHLSGAGWFEDRATQVIAKRGIDPARVFRGTYS